MGAVMLIVGSATVRLGASSVLGAGGFTAASDSEMRFYAVRYVVAGAGCCALPERFDKCARWVCPETSQRKVGRSVPPAGFEPAHHAPEACALSPELRGPASI
jgi:hypothetical protein